MFTKGSLIRGWFIGATVFTCFTFSDYLSAHYFNDSKIPWLIGVIAALAISWSAGSALKQIR